jgi:hypothetical protein
VTTHHRSEDGTTAGTPSSLTAQHYEITVRGHLAPRWSTWFDGLELTRNDDGTTVIAGPVVDQSALHGLLQKLRDLGIPLVSLTTTTSTRFDNTTITDTERP